MKKSNDSISANPYKAPVSGSKERDKPRNWGCSTAICVAGIIFASYVLGMFAGPALPCIIIQSTGVNIVIGLLTFGLGVHYASQYTVRDEERQGMNDSKDSESSLANPCEPQTSTEKTPSFKFWSYITVACVLFACLMLSPLFYRIAPSIFLRAAGLNLVIGLGAFYLGSQRGAEPSLGKRRILYVILAILIILPLAGICLNYYDLHIGVFHMH